MNAYKHERTLDSILMMHKESFACPFLQGKS